MKGKKQEKVEREGNHGIRSWGDEFTRIKKEGGGVSSDPPKKKGKDEGRPCTPKKTGSIGGKNHPLKEKFRRSTLANRGQPSMNQGERD